jgi:hypothetical protein
MAPRKIVSSGTSRSMPLTVHARHDDHERHGQARDAHRQSDQPAQKRHATPGGGSSGGYL